MLAVVPIAAVRAQKPEAPVVGARQLLAAGIDAAAERDLVAARAAFRKILAGSESHYGVLARVGLAEVARLDGRAFDGLRELRLGSELLAGLVRSEAWDALCSDRAIEERARCHIALGVLDRAVFDVEQLVARKTEDPATRYTRGVLEFDLAMARTRHERAASKIRRLLDDDDVVGLGEGVALLLQRRGVLADLALADSPARYRDVALEIERLLESAEGSAQFRLQFDATEAWIGALELERADEASGRLIGGAGSAERANEQRRAEALAQRARLAMQAGASIESLRSMRDELAIAMQYWFQVWRASPLRRGGAGLFAYSHRRDVLSALLSLDRRVDPADGGSVVALQHLESALALGTLSRQLGARSPSLAEVHERLVPDGGGLLLQVSTRRGGHLLAIDAAGCSHTEFVGDSALEADLTELARSVERMPADRSTDAVDALRQRAQRVASRILPQELRERIAAWRQVVLVGEDSTLATVLPILPIGDSWWCLERSMRHVPSLALAMHVQRRGPSASPLADAAQWALLGDPVQRDDAETRWGVEPLALTANQRARIVAAGGSNLHVSWGSDATVAALSEPQVSGASVLCLLAHGVRDYERERYAGVLLAGGPEDEGALFADRIEQLRVGPLVVLAVCRAGDGPQRRGDDGSAHLGGAFLRAGAQGVVLARGDLAVGATVDLLSAFLSELRPGIGAANALRLARVQIAADPRRAHPWYFAGLRLVGADVIR